MTIKKVYVDMVEFLEENKNKKVSTVLDEIYLMASSKKKTTTYLRDENGIVFAIFCYYHKQWELPSDVPYGSKANTATGFNTMCKVGVSKWTKAQRDAKLANANILTDVANGDIEPSAITEKLAEIETNRTVMDITDMPEGVTVDFINAKIDEINKAILAKEAETK